VAELLEAGCSVRRSINSINALKVKAKLFLNEVQYEQKHLAKPVCPVSKQMIIKHQSVNEQNQSALVNGR